MYVYLFEFTKLLQLKLIAAGAPISCTCTVHVRRGAISNHSVQPDMRLGHVLAPAAEKLGCQEIF